MAGSCRFSTATSYISWSSRRIPGESFSPLDFDFDADPARLELMASLYNSDIPDLTAIAEAGGKMITWHGLADAIVPKTEA